MEIFRFTLKNAKLRSYKTMSWLLVLLNIVALIIFSHLQESLRNDRPFVYGLLALSILFYFVKRTDTIRFNNKKELIGTLFFFFALLWLKWGMYTIVGANVLFLILYVYSVRRFEVAVRKMGISYPSFPKREIEWTELQNIVMKDGLLTIDFKNNKLLQNEIDAEVDVNEKDFNEFCRQQLNQ